MNLKSAEHKINKKGMYMRYSEYRSVTGTIRSIQSGTSCCVTTLNLRNDRENVNFVVTGDTKIIDSVQLRKGMRVIAFYDGSLPAPAIYPPQFHAELIASLRQNQEAQMNFFDNTLTAIDNSLKLNLSPRTKIETLNGQPFRCSPRNQELLVFYTATTFSIPPQTTPQRIIVMCGDR